MKKIFRNDLTEEEVLAILRYLTIRLLESTKFNTNICYWYHQSKYIDHFVLTENIKGIREQTIANGCVEFRENYQDSLKYFDLSFLMDDFNADFVFELKDNVDLTYLYGLSRITV